MNNYAYVVHKEIREIAQFFKEIRTWEDCLET
jgi:hypothetical protein